MMSGNDVVIGEEGRWFKEGVDVDTFDVGGGGFLKREGWREA